MPNWVIILQVVVSAITNLTPALEAIIQEIMQAVNPPTPKQMTALMAAYAGAHPEALLAIAYRKAA